MIYQWNEIKCRYSDLLLLGNGASRAINNGFAYNNLKERAAEIGIFDGGHQDLFDRFETADFEYVLRKLWQTSLVNEVFEVEHHRVQDAYTQIRDALVRSVRAVHPEYAVVDQQNTIRNVYNFIRQFKTVAALNYDLIVYWAVMYGRDLRDGYEVKDCFTVRSAEGNRFDSDWEEYRAPYRDANNHVTLVFYPHGCLSLVKGNSGLDIKISVRNELNLLDEITNRWNDAGLIPVFVSEGRSEEKLESIRSSQYLSTVYFEALTQPCDSLTVYGWDFGSQDLHILKALKKAAPNRVAVSVYNNDEDYCERISRVIRQRVSLDVEIDFFHSDSPGCWSHPVPNPV
ncbi:DUF4917 family protein [Salinicola sp. DM10]|uniref:DUF4917 family protein n=1 Tax=Salinicola sp. DM10 TaxID=2815721 RepID=UPI001A8F1159|nr:DUF4917 family protein [Salinicola sp. DM10]MCE3028593.1 DUF4917 family protein [Salinicola sp. DM10]